MQKEKISLILIAYHYCSENIASRRFQGLLKYLSHERYSIQVFSGPTEGNEMVQPGCDVTSIEAPLLSQALITSRLSVLIQMIKSTLGFTTKVRGSSWVANVVNDSRNIVQKERQLGHRVIVVATYSPIDALIAGRLIADAEGVPLIQDFRDGLVYDNHGRKGILFHYLRKRFETWAVHSSNMITTVSHPLVAYFKRTYPDCSVELLYNGFDCDLLSDLGEFKSKGKELYRTGLVLGHFGRISASDGGSFKTLNQFVDMIEEGFSGTLEFYGTLLEFEVALLSNTRLNCVMHEQVSRDEALSNMERMTGLLLITSDKESVATGKIFEYLFSGRRIILVTQCRNEAAYILEMIGDDDIIINFSEPSTVPSVIELETLLKKPFVRNFEYIERFQKSNQAQKFSCMLEHVD